MFPIYSRDGALAWYQEFSDLTTVSRVHAVELELQVPGMTPKRAPGAFLYDTLYVAPSLEEGELPVVLNPEIAVSRVFQPLDISKYGPLTDAVEDVYVDSKRTGYVHYHEWEDMDLTAVQNFMAWHFDRKSVLFNATGAFTEFHWIRGYCQDGRYFAKGEELNERLARPFLDDDALYSFGQGQVSTAYPEDELLVDVTKTTSAIPLSIFTPEDL